MEETKNTQELRLEETQCEPEVIYPDRTDRIIGIVAGILTIIGIASIVGMFVIEMNGGPHGVFQTIVTIIGSISVLIVVSACL